MSEAKKTNTNEENFNVDEALKRLEDINSRLSDKDIELNESIELYKEGTLLASKCRDKLKGIEKELKILNE